MILDEIVRSYNDGDRGITHLVAARDGQVIAEWYRHPVGRESPHMLHSATKSFVSVAIGMALDEGALSRDDKLVDYLRPEQVAIAAPGVEDITVAHMLTMRTGHQMGTSGVAWRKLDTSWVDDYLRVPITGTPGKDFIYSSGTSHMLSMVLQKATGLPADEYLRPRLFDPLEFGFVSWDRDPDGICSGGNGLTINVVDFLKWGQLLLDRGVWNGKRILSESWVTESLTRHVDVGGLVWTGNGYGAADDAAPGEGEGYGLQVWHYPGGNYASGIFGQYCVIVPETNSVVAVYSSLSSKDANSLSVSLIDALGDERYASFVPGLSGGFGLDEELSDAAALYAAAGGTFESGDGKTRLRFTIDEPGATVLTVQGRDATGEVEFSAGLGHDHEFAGPLAAPSLHHSYTEHTRGLGRLTRRGPWWFEAKLVYPTTPFVDRYTFELINDGTLRYSRAVNVNSQSTSIDEVTVTRVECSP